ncbi:unnamed protein product, partial [Phaeothamnion confervicola]
LSVGLPDHAGKVPTACGSSSFFELTRHRYASDGTSAYLVYFRTTATACTAVASTSDADGAVPVVEGVPLHLVVTIETGMSGIGVVSFYVNGTLGYDPDIALGNKFSFKSVWTTGKNYTLNVFADGRVSDDGAAALDAWPGEVYLAALYDRALDSDEIWQNYQAGFNESAPVAADVAANVMEDGDADRYYSATGLYQEYVPVLNLSEVVLKVSDMDDNPAFFPTYVYDSWGETAGNASVFVSALPGLGQLYEAATGAAVTKTPHQVMADVDGRYVLRYRPEKDENSGAGTADGTGESVYTNFTYYAVDSSSGERSAADGVVLIYVLPANDAPIAVNSSKNVYITGSGYIDNIIFLTGSDVDLTDGDSIAAVRVVAAPAYGTLYEVGGNGVATAMAVASGGMLPAAMHSVNYAFDRSLLSGLNLTGISASGGIIWSDAFTFEVTDESAVVSNIATVSLTVIYVPSAGSLPSVADGARAGGAAVEYRMPRSECKSGTFAPEEPGAAGTFGQLAVDASGGVYCLDGLGVGGTEAPTATQRLTSALTATAFIDQLSASASATASSSSSTSTFASGFPAGSADDAYGFSAELWLRHGALSDAATTYTYTFMTIGQRDTQPSKVAKCSGYSNFELSRVGGAYRASLRYKSSGGVVNCMTTKTTAHELISDSTLVHLVVTVDVSNEIDGWTYPEATFYHNGSVVYRSLMDGLDLTADGGAFDFGTHWDPDYVLHLLGDARGGKQSYRPWPGRLHLVAVYPRLLNATEISRNFAAGLANSLPVAHDVSAVVNEDGEIGDHYNDPAFYTRLVPPLELATLALNPADQDTEPDFFPTYEALAPPTEAFVASLPANGVLFDWASGAEITAAALPFLVARRPSSGGDASGSSDSSSSIGGRGSSSSRSSSASSGEYLLRYRPAKDACSARNGAVFDSFTYYSLDGATGNRSAENGTVSIAVTAKDDPPVVANVTAVVYGGSKDNFVDVFQATDVDAGDSVSGAVIVRIPQKGIFRQVKANGVRAQAVIRDGDAAWTSLVAYEFTGTADDACLKPGCVAFDSFSVFVTDADGRRSVTATLPIEVYASVVAESAQKRGDASWMTYEDGHNRVTLYGHDNGDSPRPIRFAITSLPRYGELFDPVTSRHLAAGDSLAAGDASPYTAGSAVIYVPRADFFTSPATAWNDSAIDVPNGDSFEFYVYVTVDPGFRSAPTTQLLAVVNVNDAVEMLCPSVAVTDATRSNRSDDDGDSSGGDGKVVVATVSAFGTTPAAELAGELSLLDRVQLYNFTVSDKDFGVDAIRVEVTAEYGMLTLNDEHLPALDFNSATYCGRQSAHWGCAGSGDSDRRLSFLGQPADVAAALSGMRYHSYKSDVTDTVNVTLYDGAGGAAGCMDSGTFKTASMRTACYTATCSFAVLASPGWVSTSCRPAVCHHGHFGQRYRLLPATAATEAVLSCFFLWGGLASFQEIGATPKKIGLCFVLASTTIHFLSKLQPFPPPPRAVLKQKFLVCLQVGRRELTISEASQSGKFSRLPGWASRLLP